MIAGSRNTTVDHRRTNRGEINNRNIDSRTDIIGTRTSTITKRFYSLLSHQEMLKRNIPAAVRLAQIKLILSGEARIL